MPEDASIIGRVLRSGAPLIGNDLQTLEMPLAARAALMDSGFRSAVAYPLLVDRTPVGALMLTSYDVGAVGDEESRMLRELVANLSFALQYLPKEDEVRFLSYFDQLTGLAKRGLFCERVVRILEPRIGRRGTPAVAVLDIEHLSTINDSFGRHAGDQLLQQIADRLKRHLDSTELLAHFGGGTFGLTSEAAGDEDEAVHWMRESVIEVSVLSSSSMAAAFRGCEVRLCALSRQWQRRQRAGAECRSGVAQRQEHGRKISAAPARSVSFSDYAHDDGASAACRRRTPGVRAALSTQGGRAFAAIPWTRSAGALARSGGGAGDAQRVSVADGIEWAHRAAG
jgi:diguanylate cyclase (GGDEF)-like protein